jgi:hypothetical protein
MFNSGVLDVAIGLIFIYLVLSLVCSSISEIIEAKLKIRAVGLERGIRELLSNKDDVRMVKNFYDHPLIFSLFPGSYDPGKVDAKTKRYARNSNLPSYIPSRNFALALMDLMLPANSAAGGTSTLSGAAGATAVPPAAPNPPGATGAVAPPPNTPTAPKPLQPLRDAISRIDNDNLKQALLPLVDAAGDDVSKARENIEGWYDSAMDRVSGWYKRRVQWIILGLGLGIAIVVNADTITISNSLSRDVSMRNSLVAAAQEYAKADPSPLPASPNPDDKIDACRKNENSSECRVARNLSQIRQLGLPVGWDPGDIRTVPGTFEGWATKVLGWFLTAAAISLGAPFWFDLLNKIMVIRSTVRPREKSPEEPPIDRA